MSLFRSVFNCETPDQMLQSLHSLEAVHNYNQAVFSIENSFENFFLGE